MKRATIITTAILLALGGLGFLFRNELILFIVTKSSKVEVGPAREIAWQKGPEQADVPLVQRPPNIVFIVVDDLGNNDISTFGRGIDNGRFKTPNIDRLAAEGVVFTQAYSGSSTCAVSRAMLMTGRYPTRTGFEFTPTPGAMSDMVARIGNQKNDLSVLPPIKTNPNLSETRLPYEAQGLPSEEITIAETLKEAGYHTVHIGKWHLGRSKGFAPNDQGFDESLLMGSGCYLPENHPNVVNAKLPFDPIDSFLWAQLQYAAVFNSTSKDDYFKPGGYLTDWWTDESLKVIEANKHRPFFLYLAHWGVHTPLQATRADYEAVGDLKPERLRVYAAMIRAVDRSVGRIMDKLKEEGLDENTLVVLTSDNGGPGYLGLPDVNQPYRGWKITLFEGGIRVPLFMKWPGKIKPGTTVDAPVNHIDVMPTFTAAANAMLPDGVAIDGQNLLPAAQNGVDIERPNDAIFWSSGFYKVVRAGDWKLQVNERQSKKWLFNLAEDPSEKNNLTETQPDKLAELQGLIDEHFNRGRKPLYSHAIEMPIRIDKTSADPFEKGDEYIVWPN